MTDHPEEAPVIQVVHYLNQFFGGLGGEDHADAPLEVREGPVGPGQALQAALGEAGRVTRTLVCGDNYFHDHQDEVLEAALAALGDADLLVAGPAFNAGRYGLACALLCATASETLELPALTGMYPENPAVEMFHDRVVMVPTGSAARDMLEAVGKMAEVGVKLVRGTPLGPAAEEGILPRGYRDNHTTEVPAARRAVDMLLRKLAGQPFESEIPILQQPEPVEPAPGIPDLSEATVALVTEGGLVPRGNPDQIESSEATRWARYPVARLEEAEDDFESIHGGYDNRWVNDDPDRLVPLDAIRAFEREGIVGRVHDHYYVTVGTGMSVENAERIGTEIAHALINEGVQAVVLTST